LTLDGQTGAGTGRYADLNLNGFNQELAGLTNTPRSLRVQRIVNSDLSAAATLTVNNSTTCTFSGSLGGSAAGSIASSVMPGSSNGNNFALTKRGAGILTLSGTNSYSGDTLVEAGTLALGSTNASNNSSSVVIAPTGALLKLGFSGTDTVARLYIGAIEKPAGIYGHSSSGATNGGLGVGAMDAFFASGTGTLTVTSGPLPEFAVWINGPFANGASVPVGSRGPNDDPDRDGMPNLLEYALDGLDPTRRDLVSGTFVDGTLSFTKRPDTVGLGFLIEQSPDLGVTSPWTEVSGSSYLNQPGLISYAIPAAAPTRTFLRLRVHSN